MQYNYFHYTNDKIPQYGTAVYFAYRKLNNETKEVLYALDQIKSQIISCTELYNNIEVTQEKMNWWIKEINRIKNNDINTSPQLTLLRNYFDNETLYNLLHKDINIAIDNSSVEERNFIEHCKKSYFGIEKLKAIYLLDSKDVDDKIIEQINLNNEICRHIFCIPKHYYNHIRFDEKMLPNMEKETFKNISQNWLQNINLSNKNKKLSPLITLNKIHYKMTNKFIKKVDSPFRQSVYIPALSLLMYSI